VGGWRVGKGGWLLGLVGLFVYMGIHCADIILTCFLLLYSLLYVTQVDYQEESLNQLNPEFYYLEDSGLLHE